MNKPRQDAWTKDEDAILAEIVLSHIRQGKTQLEAFQQAAKKLLRTPAACGFRWNATIRQKHLEQIEEAKNSRKQLVQSKPLYEVEQQTIESAISMLEKMKEKVTSQQFNNHFSNQENLLVHLQEENEKLKLELKRYEEAWSEMKNLWDWVEENKERM